MVEPVFDRFGRVVAWRRRERLFDREGRAVAFVWDRAVFRYDGAWLGWLLEKYYWTKEGLAVACERGAGGGPQPSTSYEPLRPPVLEAGPPLPALGAAPPPPRLRTRRWADLSWDEFLDGRA